MPPGPLDRPSVCAVVGDRYTIMLDAGSSPAHTLTFLHGLAIESERRPSAVVYTHCDWDHVLGGAEVRGLVIAHSLTADGLGELAERDWSDEGLDRRVALGLSSPQHAADVKAELPSPRTIDVAPADVVFDDGVELRLGGVNVHVSHVGGDHSTDSTVMWVEPDGLLFHGDCLSASPEGALTPQAGLPLRDTILGFDAEYYVEGHHESVSSGSEIERLLEKMEHAERAAREGAAIAAPDEDTEYFLEAFRIGLRNQAVDPPRWSTRSSALQGGRVPSTDGYDRDMVEEGQPAPDFELESDARSAYGFRRCEVALWFYPRNGAPAVSTARSCPPFGAVVCAGTRRGNELPKSQFAATTFASNATGARTSPSSWAATSRRTCRPRISSSERARRSSSTRRARSSGRRAARCSGSADARSLGARGARGGR